MRNFFYLWYNKKNMLLIDYIIIIFILGLALLGMRRGFLLSLGSVVSVIFGFILAFRFYPTLSNYWGSSNTVNIISFLFIFSLSAKLISLCFWLLGKVFQLITVLPFISSIDKLLGFFIGFIKAVVIAIVLLTFFTQFPFNDWLFTQINSSMIGYRLVDFGIFIKKDLLSFLNLGKYF